MRLTRYAVGSLVVLCTLAACATGSSPRHESQRDAGTDFAAYRSFAWQPSLGEGAGDQPTRLLDARIRDAVRAELVARGYVEDEASPGFRVTYETTLKDKVKSSPFRIGIGMGGFSGNVGGSVNVGTPSVKNYQEGTLVIHVIDAASRREVWYGTVSGEVDRSSLDAAAVARAVGIAMEGFPKRAP
ncbi:MAG: DUF4136 domain-containing protein [Gammaproteobacteria bacterium]|nr:MAG: DUF4136 domain-containing protein [Gammaproteobacteria bacterium]